MTVRLLSDLSPLEKLSLIDVSYSRLETYAGNYGCEAKYFYSYVLKEERVQNVPALLGNILHSTLENQLEPNEPPSLVELLKEYENQTATQDVDKIIDKELLGAGVTMLTDFADRHDGEVFPILEKEKAFSIVLGAALISGYIDRVDIEGDRIVVTDYKSGKYEVPKSKVSENLQLGIYALALATEYPNKDIYAQLYYLRSGHQRGHLFTTDDLNEVELTLSKFVKQIIERETFHYTSNARICHYCDFAKSGVCPTGSRRVRSRK